MIGEEKNKEWREGGKERWEWDEERIEWALLEGAREEETVRVGDGAYSCMMEGTREGGERGKGP